MNIKKYNEIADKKQTTKASIKTYMQVLLLVGWSDWYDRRIFFKSLSKNHFLLVKRKPPLLC